MSNEVKTFTKLLAGREIEFRVASMGQVIILHRLGKRALERAEQAPDAEGRGDKMASVMVQVLDFIENLIVSDADKQFVEDKMLAGEIDYPELLSVLGTRGDEDKQEDDQPPAAKKRVPRKTAKKVAKKAAPRGRTAR